MIVSNSTPIIFLGKSGKLHILKRIFRLCLIPEKVSHEIFQKSDSPEATALKKALKEKWIKIEKSEIYPLLQTSNLGLGEKEAISLASKKKCDLLIDDNRGRNIASVVDVRTHGTLYVIQLAVKKQLISVSDAEDIINAMVLDGFYISTEVFGRVLSELRSGERNR